MKAEKRHVSYKQGARPCLRDHDQVVIHHRHADGKVVIKPKAYVADAIADKNDVDDRIGDACRYPHHKP